MHLLSINLWLQGRNDEIWEVSFNLWDNCFKCATILQALPDISTSLSSSIYQSSSNRSIREMKWVVSNLVNYFLNLKIYFTNIVRNIKNTFQNERIIYICRIITFLFFLNLLICFFICFIYLLIYSFFSKLIALIFIFLAFWMFINFIFLLVILITY